MTGESQRFAEAEQESGMSLCQALWVEVRNFVLTFKIDQKMNAEWQCKKLK